MPKNLPNSHRKSQVGETCERYLKSENITDRSGVKEWWGLATTGSKQMLASDGSSNLFTLELPSLKV